MESFQMEEERLLHNSGVRHRIKSCLFAKNASHSFVRGFVKGCLIAITIAQISAYNMLSKSVNSEDLPWFIIDLVIVSIGCVEVVLSPVVGWFGFRRRRSVMLGALAVTCACTLLLLAVPEPDATEPSGFCTPGSVTVVNPAPDRITSKAYLGLALITVYGLVCSLTIVTVWSHGVAYMDEHTTDGMSLQYGLIIGVRIIALALFPKVLLSMKTWIQVIAIIAPLAIHIIQLLKMPEVAPPAEGVLVTPFDKRGFMRSTMRVMSSGLVVSQLVTMSLLGSALWGFGYSEPGLVRVLHGLQYSADWKGTFADALRFQLVVLFVVFFARKFSKPAMLVFDKVAAVQFSTRFCVVVPVLYIVMVTLLRCERGVIGGLGVSGGLGGYDQPACSVACGCSSQRLEYDPVCIVDDMTTYLTPCAAGCTTSHVFGGIKSLGNCTCGAISGRATIGACSSFSCFLGFELHKLVFLLCIILNVLIFMSQGLVILREVDTRDRSVALGLMCAFVALFAFVFGHSAYFVIRYYTCAWSEGGVCRLHDTTYPLVVGGTSASLASIATVVSFITKIMLGRKQKLKNDVPLDIHASH